MVKIATFAKAAFLSLNSLRIQGSYSAHAADPPAFLPTPSSSIHHISLVTVVFRTCCHLLIVKGETIDAVYKAKLAASPKFVTVC